MLSYFKAFTIFSLWVVIALTTHFFITHKHLDNWKNQKKSIEETSNNLNTPFLITDDNNNILFSFNGNFTIHRNNSLVSNNLNLKLFRDSLTVLMNNDYSKELHITGSFNQEEANNPANKNLGLKRSNTVKKVFIKLGLVSSKIKTLSEILNYTYTENNTYLDGIKLKLTNLNQSTIDSIEQTIKFKTLYIDFNNNELIPNNSLIVYTKILNQYLNRNPDKKILIVGHTDNLGYFKNNIIIGLNKANKLKDYLSKNGIDKTNIKTSSKGESEPIATKLTKKGREKNNRIEIKINSQ